MTKFIKKSYSELSTEELYTILKFRIEIFILEQQSFYLDLDNRDQQATHFIAMDDNKIVAYARVIASDTIAKAQRICVAKECRNQQIGSLLMDYILNHINTLTVALIELDAQAHLQKFYEKYGFQPVGESYDDGGIMHIKMKKLTR